MDPYLSVRISHPHINHNNLTVCQKGCTNLFQCKGGWWVLVNVKQDVGVVLNYKR